MKPSLKVYLEGLRQTGLSELFEVLEESFGQLGIDFYLIGALARDAWFFQDEIMAKGTKDVDFAVLVPSEEAYKNLKTFLIDQRHFVKVSKNQFSLISPNGKTIDLLPFGEIQDGGQVVELAGKGLVSIDVQGLMEVYENGTVPVEFDEKFTFKLASLPAIVLLKFIAFDDRPEVRIKDIEDIGLILKYYSRIEYNRILNEHWDLFDEMDLYSRNLPGRVIGREIGTILKASSGLRSRFQGILMNATENFSRSTIVEKLAAQSGEPLEQEAKVLQQILLGLNEMP